jgi:crotonobetainyl-CoA:carnitine CoA-transferase CaiB-like acyl-CoA transferase
VRTAPPKFGANTVAVLDEAGYSAQEIQRMISDAVVKTTNE